LSAKEILAEIKLSIKNMFINIIFNENFITELVYDYKNGKKKTLKLLASGSLN
jgi:hypothetical protein